MNKKNDDEKLSFEELMQGKITVVQAINDIEHGMFSVIENIALLTNLTQRIGQIEFYTLSILRHQLKYAAELLDKFEQQNNKKENEKKQ